MLSSHLLATVSVTKSTAKYSFQLHLVCRLFLVRQGGLRRGGGQRPLQMVVWVEMLKQEVDRAWSGFTTSSACSGCRCSPGPGRKWELIRGSNPDLTSLSLNLPRSGAFQYLVLLTWLLSAAFLGIQEYRLSPLPGTGSWTWEEEFVPFSVH